MKLFLLVSQCTGIKDLPLLRRQGDLVRSCLLPHLARLLYEYGDFFQVRYIISHMHRRENPKNGQGKTTVALLIWV